MKIQPARADAFVADPPAAVRVALVYGPDRGLVSERTAALIRAVAEDPGDPFRVVAIAGAAIASDPARFADEAAAIAMTGGRRVVVVSEAGDGLAPIVAGFLDEPVGDALVVLEAGDLSPRSALRRTIEGADNAAAIACYSDRADGLERLIATGLADFGVRADRDAQAYLAAHLGADRLVTRRELEKLALYVGGGNTATLDDAVAAVGDSAALSLEEVAYAVAAGDRAGLERGLARCFEEGVSPIAILRAVARHIQRLHFVCGMIARGTPAAVAIKALRPPVIFLFADRFRGQVERWSRDRLDGALEILTEAELDCKSTALPDAAMCGRALMRIAQAAQFAG